MENNLNNGFFEEPTEQENQQQQEPQEDVIDIEITDEDIQTAANDYEDVEITETSDTTFEIIDQMPEDADMDIFSEDDAGYENYDAAESKKKNKLWPVILVTALISTLLTSLICGAFYIFTTPKNQSTIIYRDGNDMRTKIDLMKSLGLDEADDGKPLSVTTVATRVGPSVVGISAQGKAATNTIFGLIEQPFSSTGTGFIISTDGYIVTNNHVIENADQIVVTLDNDSEYTATLVGTDLKTDLAVLKIDAKGLTPAVLGSSGDVQVGEVAIAIGNPLGLTLSGTVTSGIISATNRKVTLEGIEYTLLQTDAAINSGNSGGPLLNAYGEVIGINNAKIAASGVEGLGFAIPADIAKPIIEDLIAVGYVRGRPLIGINGRNITEEISEYYNLPIGVYVVSVVEFSAAEKAGLQIGDVITHCNGQKIATVDELNKIRDEHSSGDTLNLKVVRAEKTIDIDVVLGEDRPSVALN